MSKKAHLESSNNSEKKPRERRSGRRNLEEPQTTSPSQSPEPLSDARNENEGGVAELTNYRLKVVDLAVHMAATQIAASIHSTASRNLESSIKVIAAEFLLASARLKSDLETFSKNPEAIDLAFVDQAYVSLSRSAEVSLIRDNQLLPLDHSSYDPLFAGAMARAQHLLESPRTQTNIVFAEQIFRPSDLLTENKVGEVFQRWGWPGLRNRDNFYDFIVRTETWFYQHLSSQSHPDDDEQFQEDQELVAAIVQVARRRSKEHPFRKIRAIIENYEPISDQGAGGVDLETLTDRAWRRNLINGIFCERDPMDRLSSKGKLLESRIRRSYRPWGLFRYLRLWGKDDPECSKLVEVLATPRNALNPSLEPSTQDSRFNSRYYFGPLEIQS